MPRKLTTDRMKQMVRQHFDDLVNQRIATVIPKNMTPDLYDHGDRGGKPTDVAGDERITTSADRLIRQRRHSGDVFRSELRWTHPDRRRTITGFQPCSVALQAQDFHTPGLIV